MLGVLPGIIGSIEAVEAIKLILGKGEPLIGRLLLFDALAMEFREMKLDKDPHCPVCGEDPTITALIDYEQFCGVPFPEAAAPERSRCIGSLVDVVIARGITESSRRERVLTEKNLSNYPGCLLHCRFPHVTCE